MVKHATIRLLMASALLAATSGCSSSSGSDESDPPAKKSAANTKANADAGAAQDAGAVPTACHWDARLDRGDDAPRGACHAKRHLLSCALGGTTEICLSEEPQCADADESACEDQCQPDEYAIVCGAIGPDTGNPDPPAACHSSMATPGGTFFMCCPCE